MERASRIRNLWAWLPGFRAIAETEHLPSASEALHVSASSLSRTLHHLEEELGAQLFDRVGRRIVLNAAGQELLRATRDSMRRVDDALTRIADRRLMGPVRVSVAAPFVPIYLLPALRSLRERHPDVVPHVTSLPDGEVNGALLRGDIDVAVLEDPVPAHDVVVRELSMLEHVLCRGSSHPLGRASREFDPREDGFVAPCPMADGRVPDAWPPDRPRRIDLFVTHLQAGVDACASGEYLAVLPWPVAARAGLERVSVEPISSSTLYLAHRPALSEGGRSAAVVDAILAARDAAPATA